MTYFFPVFGCFCIFLLWLNYELHKDEKQNKKKDEIFWEREQAVNSVRKVPLEKIPFITIPYEQFPIGRITDTQLQECEEKLLSLKDKPILNVTGKTATDLKEEYGPANLPLMNECDENFLLLVKTLSGYGSQLFTLGFESEAVSVLEFGICIHSDVMANYHLLAEIYHKNQQTDKIEWLLSTADSLNSLMKRSIRKDILNITCHNEE